MAMPKYSFEVPPRRRDEIIEAAVSLRRALRITNPMFPILQVVEVLLPQHDPEFSFEVKEYEELGNQHGLTRPEMKEMWIREDVYEGARNGNGRDRFTIAHELGHYLLHNEPGLARTLKPRGSFPVELASTEPPLPAAGNPSGDPRGERTHQRKPGA